MVFGKKKNKEPKEVPQPTEVVDAGTEELEKEEEEEPSKDTKFIVDEFTKKYNGIVQAEDYVGKDPHPLMINLLFSIFGELRLLRKLQEKEK